MKTNQFRAMMLVLLMAVISLGRMNAQVITVSGTVTDAKDGNPLVVVRYRSRVLRRVQ